MVARLGSRSLRSIPLESGTSNCHGAASSFLGEISTEDVQRAIDEPENEVDFGVAPADWLILWGVEWEVPNS